MSLDIYCYKSEIGKPTADEAKKVLAADDIDNNVEISPIEKRRMENIAEALLKFNQRLERVQPYSQEIAKSINISIEDAERRIQDIEINTPEDDEFYTQINIFRNNVSISFGLSSPDEIFDKVDEYIEIICKTAGYFVYDPQNENAYDLLHPIPLDDHEKKSWIENDDINFLVEKKPWWKFW